MKTDTDKHIELANWAAACAEHVLFIFEEYAPADLRPRKAIEAANAWICKQISVSQARKAAFAAHAAARSVENIRAKAAARSAGHAAATAHVAAHANHAASYALKASENKEDEKNWQTAKRIKED
ncbi:MAG TPA: hypothetical protein DCQ31_12560 [Bacteroidales bacterium]|nr:hypothetical protein [Bacteroidales bacterium]